MTRPGSALVVVKDPLVCCDFQVARVQGRTLKFGVQVEWEEYWWEASDWAGMKELGAEKSGCSADGAAWRETWREAIAFDPFTGEPTVERTAHKWAHDAKVGHLLPMSGGAS